MYKRLCFKQIKMLKESMEFADEHRKTSKQ